MSGKSYALCVHFLFHPLETENYVNAKQFANKKIKIISYTCINNINKLYKLAFESIVTLQERLITEFWNTANHRG